MSSLRDPREKMGELEVIALRCEGVERLVLANGLFDLLHVGHARYLADARSRGDALVVALNDDDSARRYKGPERPLIPLEDRALTVAGLESVDFVTWFGETDVSHVLRTLAPRFHAKGTDYRPKTLPDAERRAHADLGIDVVIVGDPKDHATRSMIDSIVDSGN